MDEVALTSLLEVLGAADGGVRDRLAAFEAVVAAQAAVLPRFDDGRIDYTAAEVAPVVHCVVVHGGRMLLVRRGDRVGDHRGVWAGVTGYADTLRPLREIVAAELVEETGITLQDVAGLAFAAPYASRDDAAGKTWVVLPVRVELARRPEVVTNWENTGHQWRAPDRLGGLELLPGLVRVVSAALAAPVCEVGDEAGAR